jgi:hypothetical protein
VNLKPSKVKQKWKTTDWKSVRIICKASSIPKVRRRELHFKTFDLCKGFPYVSLVAGCRVATVINSGVRASLPRTERSREAYFHSSDSDLRNEMPIDNNMAMIETGKGSSAYPISISS